MKTSLPLAALLLLVNCETGSKETETGAPHDEEPEWSYDGSTGPEH